MEGKDWTGRKPKSIRIFRENYEYAHIRVFLHHVYKQVRWKENPPRLPTQICTITLSLWPIHIRDCVGSQIDQLLAAVKPNTQVLHVMSPLFACVRRRHLFYDCPGQGLNVTSFLVPWLGQAEDGEALSSRLSLSCRLPPLPGLHLSSVCIASRAVWQQRRVDVLLATC